LPQAAGADSGGPLADVGNVACFAASDWARTLTATAIDMTCGSRPD
jgi:3-oxoacyl-[acyl-carrier protein] reductase